MACRDNKPLDRQPPLFGSGGATELEREMAELLKFRISTMTAFDYPRNGVWGEEAASQKVENLGMILDALTVGRAGCPGSRFAGMSTFASAAHRARTQPIRAV